MEASKFLPYLRQPLYGSSATCNKASQERMTGKPCTDRSSVTFWVAQLVLVRVLLLCGEVCSVYTERTLPLHISVGHVIAHDSISLALPVRKLVKVSRKPDVKKSSELAGSTIRCLQHLSLAATHVKAELDHAQSCRNTACIMLSVALLPAVPDPEAICGVLDVAVMGNELCELLCCYINGYVGNAQLNSKVPHGDPQLHWLCAGRLFHILCICKVLMAGCLTGTANGQQYPQLAVAGAQWWVLCSSYWLLLWPCLSS